MVPLQNTLSSLITRMIGWISLEKKIEKLKEKLSGLLKPLTVYNRTTLLCLFTIDNMPQLFIANAIVYQYYWDTWEAAHLCGTWFKELDNKSE